MLNEIPLELLINLYCSRGNNLNTENFIKTLGQLGIKNFVLKHKLHLGLTLLRKQAFEDIDISVSSSTTSRYSSSDNNRNNGIERTIQQVETEDDYFGTVLNYNEL